MGYIYFILYNQQLQDIHATSFLVGYIYIQYDILTSVIFKMEFLTARTVNQERIQKFHKILS